MKTKRSQEKKQICEDECDTDGAKLLFRDEKCFGGTVNPYIYR